ncbi:DUF3343 domain-containing protein [Clostridium gasigenes]|uniref:Putative Se/S carrier protein-like domain-containing protein n=1 Tax=Clostridium gasigenes TaxID=94869 RepID=A0A1H0V640_9CLOT|nr:DUF3343 domain-containing protein [Clostridium gasigenes]MBB6625393.1 DUF3343 domain-containing protein [Clostridium gasigenes]MBU3090083.1 DUF3343 domain-containing protein [Clostridium gasigenes]MBU3105953.1 DUF3343 domain-containing protein [Clostridium gasigenes]MBU3109767.1 DUF3343 domain-containing protein [Clostridium gasigenes]MBU3134474.1 DUF3343 domain-containing protein [Clostridium gasigenes]
MSYFIIVFKNTYDAMSAEKKLEEKNIVLRIMPTPTIITQSCGICVRIEDRNKIDNIINDKIIEFKSIYERKEDRYNKII